MSGLSIGIAGAGLLGRLMAWRLARLGHAVSVFDPAADAQPRFDGQQAAGFSAAGMLSPLAECERGSARLAALGWRSIDRWRDISGSLSRQVSFTQRGSLLLAHRGDLPAAQRLLARMPRHGPQAQALTQAQLAACEPAVHGAAQAWLLPDEAQIDAVATLQALHDEAPDVTWHWHHRVTGLGPHRLDLEAMLCRRFDWVFDLRGCGSKPALPVRGVRGETVWLHAPGHGLTRPMRLLHPRHGVYVVPRPGDVLLVGASEIESEDRSPVSLRSAVELMAAAHSLMPALAEARILRLDRNLRPALPDNEALCEVEPGLARINGLFRHGWLIAPALVDDVIDACELAGAGAVA